MLDGKKWDGAKAYKDSKVCNMLTMGEMHRCAACPFKALCVLCCWLCLLCWSQVQHATDEAESSAARLGGCSDF